MLMHYMGTTTGRPHTITACRCKLKAAGLVRPSRKAANSSSGVEGWSLGCTPCALCPPYVWVGGGASVAAGSTLALPLDEDAPAGASAEAARPLCTLSKRPAAASIHRGSGPAPFGNHTFLPILMGLSRLRAV